MKSITIIIPLHKYDETVEEYLTDSLTSVQNLENDTKCKVMMVGPKDVLEASSILFAKLNCRQELELVENDDTDVFTQINKGVFACTTKYFSVLEFDDAYRRKWLKNVDEYISCNCSYTAYLPLNETRNEKGEYSGLLNEIAWSSSFAENDSLDGLGVLTIKELEGFMDFNVTGAIINTEDFISIGGLKPSLKIASWYEFLMRTCKYGNGVFVVPKIGYVHTIGRSDGYMTMTKSEISQEEGQWLITTARQEYFHTEDRNKKYEENGEE